MDICDLNHCDDSGYGSITPGRNQLLSDIGPTCCNVKLVIVRLWWTGRVCCVSVDCRTQDHYFLNFLWGKVKKCDGVRLWVMWSRACSSARDFKIVFNRKVKIVFFSLWTSSLWPHATHVYLPIWCPMMMIIL